MTGPILVAHRGYPARYPENSLPGLEAALELGAPAIEVDVQFAGDGVPVLFHDDDLYRTTGRKGRLFDVSYSELQSFNPGEPARFGDRFRDVRVPQLSELVDLLRSHPGVTAFIEVKQETLTAFGSHPVTDRVATILAPVEQQCVVISFSLPALQRLGNIGPIRSGWILRDLNDASRDAANRLKPDFLICNYRKVPDTPVALWPGPWSWMVYTIDDPRLALTFARRGIPYIETNDIGAMLTAPELPRSA
jgi:glycerophosphoryl diester phosphodiesterase